MDLEYFARTHNHDGQNSKIIEGQDLSDYVTNEALATELADYVTSDDLATELADYVTGDDLTTALGDYATTTDVSDAIADITPAISGSEVTEYTSAALTSSTTVSINIDNPPQIAGIAVAHVKITKTGSRNFAVYMCQTSDISASGSASWSRLFSSTDEKTFYLQLPMGHYRFYFFIIPPGTGTDTTFTVKYKWKDTGFTY